MANQHHVLYDEDKGDWYTQKDGATRASARASTKGEMEKIAREISKNQNTELVIHGKDGKIQRKDSHGNDPRNIPG